MYPFFSKVVIPKFRLSVVSFVCFDVWSVIIEIFLSKRIGHLLINKQCTLIAILLIMH
jgi:hypothetical protein